MNQLTAMAQHTGARVRKRWPAFVPHSHIYLFVSLFVVLLAILTLTFQLNRQLADQQQIFVSRNAHAAVRHASQLMREHLRLYAMFQAPTAQVAPDAIQLQWDLVASRVRVMEYTLHTVSPTEEALQYYAQYAAQWKAIQEPLALWLAEHGKAGNRNEVPQETSQYNEEIKQQLATAMMQMEQDANQLAAHLQFHFENEMKRWAGRSQFLNRLLTGSSLSFIVIILVMAVMIQRFSQAQAATERSLRTGEERLRVILDTLPDAVYRIRHDGICTDYKPAREFSLAHTRETVHNFHITDVLPPESAEIFVESVHHVLVTGEQHWVEFQQARQTDTGERSYEARFLPSGQDEVQIIVRDITEAKRHDQAVLQAQKMESLGLLAGGIAHDFNNLLTGMLGQASLAEVKLKRGLPAAEHLRKIITTAERAADLTRQLLAYTGKGKFHIVPLDVNLLIQETTGLMETALPNRVELVLDLDPQLPAIQADRGQIQQVVMNLFINSVEALPEHPGTITVTTQSQKAPAPMCLDQTTDQEIQPGDYVVMSIKDTGIGMDQATLDRIFDPFFSTKTKGHGLGLSAIRGIIHMHKGTLRVKSQPGQGTLFTIWLPAIREEVREVNAPRSSDFGTSTPFQQTVLVIDDEAAIRETATDILAERGFTVLCAANGYEGIEIVKRYPEEIGIVLLDIKMPGMDGKETFHKLRKIQPDLRVIFTSGYSESEVGADVHQADHITFLPKPYSIDGLTQQVQTMLAADAISSPPVPA